VRNYVREEAGAIKKPEQEENEALKNGKRGETTYRRGETKKSL